MENQIKSLNRVRDLAEVYTGKNEINKMLNLFEDNKIETKYLESSCGNGNFLVEILQRKLKLVFEKYKDITNIEFYSLYALSNIYGIDICKENIQESNLRMLEVLKENYSFSANFLKLAKFILQKNIVKGDSLKEIKHILFTEFKFYIKENMNYVEMKTFTFVDILEQENKGKVTPIIFYAPILFKDLLKLSNEDLENIYVKQESNYNFLYKEKCEENEKKFIIQIKDLERKNNRLQKEITELESFKDLNNNLSLF